MSAKAYYDQVTTVLARIRETQAEAIDKAGEAVASPGGLRGLRAAPRRTWRTVTASAAFAGMFLFGIVMALLGTVLPRSRPACSSVSFLAIAALQWLAAARLKGARS